METPRLYILSRPSFELQEANRFLTDRSHSWADSPGATAAERLIEFCGRVCYMSFRKDTTTIRHPHDRYIRNLIASGHGSVLEHVSWSFLLDGVSRAFTHQLVRHRVGFAFSQLSQQYHDESEVVFVPPAGLTTNDRKAWTDATESLRSAYRSFIGADTSTSLAKREALRHRRSVARSLLPNATETAIAVTANGRALRHFFEVRGTIEGDYEMRAVACKIFHAIAADAPSLFLGIEVIKHTDGENIISVSPVVDQPSTPH